MHGGGGGGGGGGSGFLPVPDEDGVRAPEPARRVRIADDAMLCTWALQTLHVSPDLPSQRYGLLVSVLLAPRMPLARGAGLGIPFADFKQHIHC